MDGVRESHERELFDRIFMGSRAEDKRLGRACMNKQVLELRHTILVEITQLAVVIKPSRA